MVVGCCEPWQPAAVAPRAGERRRHRPASIRWSPVHYFRCRIRPTIHWRVGVVTPGVDLHLVRGWGGPRPIPRPAGPTERESLRRRRNRTRLIDLQRSATQTPIILDDPEAASTLTATYHGPMAFVLGDGTVSPALWDRVQSGLTSYIVGPATTENP